MATTVGNLKVMLTANTKPFESGMRGANRHVTGMRANVKNLAIGLGAAFGARALVRQMKGFISLASDAEEATSKFDTVLGSAAKETRRDLDQFADSVGRSRYALQSMGGDLAALLQPMGFTQRETGRLSSGLTRLATDLASFHNVADSEALTALRAGLVGESEPLRKFGVQLSAARIEAEALAKGLIHNKSELTPLIKAQAAYNIIMADTAVAQGDALRTSGGLANQLKTLEGAWRDLGVEIGKVMAGPATDAVSGLNEYISAIKEMKSAGGTTFTLKAVGTDLLSLFDIEEYLSPSAGGVTPQMQRLVDQIDQKENSPTAIAKRVADIADASTKRRKEASDTNRAFSGYANMAKMFGFDTTGLRRENGQVKGSPMDKWDLYNPLKAITDKIDSAGDITGLTKGLLGRVFNKPAPEQVDLGPRSAGALVKGTTAEYSARIAAGGGTVVEKKTEQNTEKTYRSVDKLSDMMRDLIPKTQSVNVVNF